MKHAILGASSSSRWINCPGSIRISKDLPPQKSSGFAAEGTAAHALAEKCFETGSAAMYFVGKEKIEGYEITADMAEHVQTYVDYVIVRRNKLHGELTIEERFDLSWLHPGMFGTNDSCIASKKVIEIIDFKYGEGIPVEAYDNSQLEYYGLGAWKKHPDVDLIIMTIVQPRCEHKDGPIRSHKIKSSELVRRGTLLVNAAKKTEKKDAPLKAGEWCRFCPAAGACPEIHREAIDTAMTDFNEPNFLPVEKLTDEQIARIIKNSSLIKGFLADVSSLAETRLNAGENIGGLKLVNKKRRRDWTKTIDELVSTFGEDIIEKKLLSVAKAEKLFGKNSVLEHHASIETGVTVAHESDRRKPVKALAVDDFEKIESEITVDDF